MSQVDKIEAPKDSPLYPCQAAVMNAVYQEAMEIIRRISESESHEPEVIGVEFRYFLTAQQYQELTQLLGRENTPDALYGIIHGIRRDLTFKSSAALCPPPIKEEASR